METKRLARTLKALSHPNRLELYLEIARKSETSFPDDGCFISEITDCLKIGAPTVSHHLKELANADLITTELRGKYLVAKINRNTVDEVTAVLRLNRPLP